MAVTIENLEKAFDEMFDFITDLPSGLDGFESDFDAAFEELKELKAALTPPNEWVSVEDTVPDPGERVLATDGIFVGEAYRTSADSWHRHTGFPWRDGVTGRTVKYWMLLSVPPAKEDQK